MTDDPLPELRASDADREHTAELLRQAAGDGRLTVEELEERLHTTYESRTRRDLERLVADVVSHDDRPVGRTLPRMPVKRGEPGTNWLVAVMSGHDRKGRWRVGPHCKVVNVMGGSNLDLNDAELSDEHTEITIVSVMGGAEVRIPDGLNVEFSEFAFMGGNDISVGEQRPDPGGPTLHLRVISIMGGCDIKRGRKLSRSERRREKELKRQSEG